jgi:adenylate kinase
MSPLARAGRKPMEIPADDYLGVARRNLGDSEDIRDIDDAQLVVAKAQVNATMAVAAAIQQLTEAVAEATYPR